jgi:hypothetical protein
MLKSIRMRSARPLKYTINCWAGVATAGPPRRVARLCTWNLSDDDLTCVDELCYEFHRRFEEKLVEKECRHLFPRWKAKSPTNNCEYIYQTASEIAVELILEAPKVIPECQQIL